jgi:protein TonB
MEYTVKTAYRLTQALAFRALAFRALAFRALAPRILLLWFPFCVTFTDAEALSLNGIALHQELGEPYYYGVLSVEQPSQDPDFLLTEEQNRRMGIRIAAPKISPRRFSKLWNESIATNNKQAILRTYQKEIQAFLMMMKADLIEGDYLVVHAAKDQKPVQISLNGVDLLRINSAGFFNVLLRCWIGEVPLTRQFRQDILGVDQDRMAVLMTQFKGLHTKPGRYEEVKQWLSMNQAGDKPLSGSNESQQPVEPLKEADIVEQDRTQLTSTIANENEYYYAAVDWASRHSSYPRKAIEQALEGVVRIRVTVDRKGNVLAIKVLQKTDYALLNQAAQQAIQKAAPFPPVPSTVQGATYSFTVPFKYQIDQQ